MEVFDRVEDVSSLDGVWRLEVLEDERGGGSGGEDGLDVAVAEPSQVIGGRGLVRERGEDGIVDPCHGPEASLAAIVGWCVRSAPER